MLFSVETALRSGELCSLEWPQVHAQQRYITLEKTKNGDTRNVPLTTRALALLALLPRDGLSVFGLEDAARDALFRKARDRTEIADLRWHDLRHEATTRLARKLTAMDLSRVTGHRDLRSLMTYYNPTASEIAERLG